MNSSEFRLCVFMFFFLSFALLEIFCSYRKRIYTKRDRWFGNIGLTLISNILIKLTVPLGLVSFADYFKEAGWGLFNSIDLHSGLVLFLSVVVLDLAIYAQHVFFHKIPFFWKLHRVHHADVDLDVTSALRFHPLEILVSIGYKALIVLVIGASPESVLTFEIILSTMAMFNHSNLHIPQKVECFLRLLVVTPQMHIIHHSVDQSESDMNFGFNLSVWDRLFGTYINDFSTNGRVGQLYYRSKQEHKLKEILLLPFLTVKEEKKS